MLDCPEILKIDSLTCQASSSNLLWTWPLYQTLVVDFNHTLSSHYSPVVERSMSEKISIHLVEDS